MLRWKWVRVCPLPLLALLCAYAHAQTFDRYQVDLGPPARNGQEALDFIPARVETVTRWNACGRELDFLRHTQRNEIGEGMLSAAMGKIRWLQTNPTHSVCLQRVRFTFDELKSYFEEGSDWVGGFQPNLEYINEQFRLIFDPNSKPYSEPDPDRQCGPIVGAATIVTDAHGHLAAQAFDVDFQVDWFCMRKQLNVALMRDVVVHNLGTEDLPCGFFKEPGDDLSTSVLAKTGEGDWDVNVRDLLRVLFMDRGTRVQLLDDATREKVFNNLITISGPLEEDSYSIYECGNQERDAGSPQDRADERDWYEEGLFDDLGDLLDWLWNRILIFAGVAALLLTGYFVYGFQWLIPVAAVVGVTGATVGFIRIPESENHLFMINTSRYLANRLIIDSLTDADDREEFEDDQKEIKDWLLERLQSVAQGDFLEYNSRPYQRYTIMAILNLHDYAGDLELEAASKIVLDFAAAKFAAGSSQGRRAPPFRRLMENMPADFFGSPPRQMFDLSGGADHQIAEMLLFAGQTQQLPNRKASIESASEMMMAAASGYRPDRIILNVAANKDRSYEQRIHHDGYEVYSSTRSYLISAGGVQTGLANQPMLGPITFNTPKGLKFDNDRGVATPTVLIPNASTRQMSITNYLRIEGPRELYAAVDEKVPGITPWSFDDNICVRRGFACGINIVVPPELDTPQCLSKAPGAPDQWRFIDSAACPAYQGAPRFFVVLFRQPCTGSNECLFTANWGFFEAVDNPTTSFEQFKLEVVERNPLWRMGGPQVFPEKALYISARNEHIEFDVVAHERDSDDYGIISINNTDEDEADDWNLASGDIIEADGGGRIKIKDPSSTRWIDIDFSDHEFPNRTIR